MPYINDPSSIDDFTKLKLAIVEIVSRFGSVQSILDSLGLSNMPMAQRYGIMFGCLVFMVTISVVVSLLIFGGTFQRIQEQATEFHTRNVSNTPSHDIRSQRPLLFEQLLEGKDRLLQRYTNNNAEHRSVKTTTATSTTSTTDFTPLTYLVLNVPSPSAAVAATTSTTTTIPSLVNEEKKTSEDNITSTVIMPLSSSDNNNNNNNNNNSANNTTTTTNNNINRILDGTDYAQNYALAYRKCQDKPGGESVLFRFICLFTLYFFRSLSLTFSFV
jgi:uncharacterized membrane protein